MGDYSKEILRDVEYIISSKKLKSLSPKENVRMVVFGDEEKTLILLLSVQDTRINYRWMVKDEKLAMNRLADGVEFVSRANYGLNLGHFALDFDDGEIFFTYAIELKKVSKRRMLIAETLQITLGTFDKYYMGIIKLVQGADAKTAIRHVEGGGGAGDLLLEFIIALAKVASVSGDKKDEELPPPYSGGQSPKITEIVDEPQSSEAQPKRDSQPKSDSQPKRDSQPKSQASSSGNSIRVSSYQDSLPSKPVDLSSASGEVLGLQLDYKELKKTKRLGAGGMGEVYKGEYMGEEVAIKCVRQDIEGVEEMESAFLKEINIQGQLQFPRIVRTLGAVKHDNVWYLVSEFCENGNLEGYAKKRAKEGEPLLFKKRIQMSLDAANGMRYLHSRRIVHNDIKPANLFVTHDERVKVGDFGLSRATATKISTVRVKSNSGGYTLAYAPPETLEGEAGTFASDVYSFGISLYEIMTDKPAYDLSKIRPEVLTYRIISASERPFPQDNFPPNLDTRVAKLMQSCWSRDPKARPTFEKIAEDLGAIIAGPPPVFPRPTTPLGAIIAGPPPVSPRPTTPLGPKK